MRLTTLDNGLRVVTETMPRVETASFGVWVDAGARYEAPEVNGVAHMLEHMAFKGTAKRTARGIAEAIEDVGGSLNAYTGREHTAYYARVLAEDVPLAADILSDILLQSTFDAEEFEKERHVILQEIGETLDTPSDLVFDQFQEAAFPGQAIGRSILGTEAVIEKLPRESLQAFVDAHYGPEALVIAASGKVEHEAIVAIAEERFGRLPRRARPVAEPSRYEGGEWLTGRDLEQVHLCLGLEAMAYTDDDFIPLQVFSTALGGGMSSRLFQEVRENRGLCYSVFSFTGPAQGFRPLRHLCRDRRGRRAGADPGDRGRGAGPGGRHRRGRAGARQGAAQGGPPDGAGGLLLGLRGPGQAVALLRRLPDPAGAGGEVRRGDQGRHRPGGGAAAEGPEALRGGDRPGQGAAGCGGVGAGPRRLMRITAIHETAAPIKSRSPTPISTSRR
jgi:hypothetical protein